MISKRIIANLVVFTSIAALLVGYGIVTLFGSPFDHQRTVVAEFPDAGGIRPGFSASHDGVVVGTVSKVQLLHGRVRITAQLDPGVSVPKGVAAQIIRASAVGEQRLDLLSIPGGSQEALPDGGTVKLAAHPVPPDVADVLKTVTDFVDALPADKLNVLVHEAALGVDGRAEDLKSITRSLSTVSDDVVAGDRDLRTLLDAAPPVLDDFSRMSPEVHQALDDTTALTKILSDRDQDLVALLKDGSDLAVVGDRVITDNRANLTCLVDDVRDISDHLQGTTLANLDHALAINQDFFGLIDRLAVKGHAKDVGYGGGARDDQLWLRTRLLVPPQSPAASSYSPPRSPRPVLTGKACTSKYGKGVAATPQPTTDLGASKVGTGPDRSGSTSAAASQGVVGSLTDLVPARQASPERTSNRDVVPLFILGIGVVVAAVTTLPARRNRRRAR